MGSSYSGVPKFVAETLSPSTVKPDRADKMLHFIFIGSDFYLNVQSVNVADVAGVVYNGEFCNDMLSVFLHSSE